MRSPQLHPRSLAKEHSAIGQNHGHFMDDVVHRAGDAKEVHEEGEGHPEALVVKESAALQDATN